MSRFELKRLASRTNEDLIREMRRVAALVPEGPLTLPEFNRLSKVHSTTLRAHFGGWREALVAAGLEHRYNTANAPLTRAKIIERMQRAAAELGKHTLTKRELCTSSTYCARAIAREFSSWDEALQAAGLEKDTLSARYTDEACFENLLAVWTHYGRPPKYKEMNVPPSRVGAKAYLRWGGWLKALEAFVDRVNRDAPPVPLVESSLATPAPNAAARKRTPRDVPLGLRFRVFERYHHRCVFCGRSAATDPTISLHVDHIIPWARGGETVIDNLQLLCSDCNLGKGARLEGT